MEVLKMKKLKLNWKGLGAILMVALGSIILIHDIIMLVKGYSYSVLGFISLILVLGLMEISFQYIEDRLKGDE